MWSTEYPLPLLGDAELLDRRWRLELVVKQLLDDLRDLDVYLDGTGEDCEIVDPGRSRLATCLRSPSG